MFLSQKTRVTNVTLSQQFVYWTLSSLIENIYEQLHLSLTSDPTLNLRVSVRMFREIRLSSLKRDCVHSKVLNVIKEIVNKLLVLLSIFILKFAAFHSRPIVSKIHSMHCTQATKYFFIKIFWALSNFQTKKIIAIEPKTSDKSEWKILNF